ncbi:MAG: SprT family zinc-dependent metalloprotease [bacterium]
MTNSVKFHPRPGRDLAVASAPMLRAFQTVAAYQVEHGKIRLTKSGAWNRHCIDWVVRRMDFPNWTAEKLYSVNKVLDEYEFVEGEGFLYLGKSYRLRLVEKQLVDLSLRNGRFCIRKASVQRGREVFEGWYARRAQDWFERQVAEQAGRVGVAVKEVKVQDLGYRWGSFGKGGRVSFHWKAILLPPRIAQYIVIHELVHGIYPDHSANFWIKVEQHLPDWRWRKAWLAENGIQVEGL